MPIIQRLLDNDAIFRNLSKPPIIINDLQNSTTQDRENIQRLITTTYSSDMVSVLPSCKCGKTKGEFSKNTICSHCSTPVSAAIENTIEPLVWFRRPNGVERLMAPITWIMLGDRFSKSKFNIIRWLTDTSYAPHDRNRPQVLQRIEELGIRRGYNHFVQNFDEIIEKLLTIKEFRLKRDQHDYLIDFIRENRSILFCDHLPLLNKTLLVIEKTSLATYIDSTVPMALDAIEMLVSIDRDFYDQTGSVKENRTARALWALSNFFEVYFKDIVASKPGLLRHYIGGSRFDFSARAVIASITDPHRYDEIEIPWGVGLTLFRPFLISKLVEKSGMIINDAVGMLLSHIGTYHPLLDQYLKEIIAETPGGRYPVLLNRFPSLLQGSIQKVYIPAVKTNPDDRTIGLSILIVAAPNA